ncbi:MAG: hypothetical protein Q8936_13590 [Bacillota bacterium]|nr:hypothetical protein [Bacillota bacterium]
MLEFYDEIRSKSIRYDTYSIRQDLEQKFQAACRKELEYFMKFHALAYEIDSLLAENNGDEVESREYFTRLVNLRAIDHFISANMLYGKGYIVDAITLLRSSIEDLWIIQNFWFTEDYLKEWKSGCEIKPRKLRNAAGIGQESKDMYKKIYEHLCNISHCRIDGIREMTKTHPKISRNEQEKEDELFRGYFVVIGAYSVYLIGVISAISFKLSNEKLNIIKKEIMKLTEEIGPLNTIDDNLEE